jgi:hypothetical protein
MNTGVTSIDSPLLRLANGNGNCAISFDNVVITGLEINGCRMFALNSLTTTVRFSHLSVKNIKVNGNV